jgi:hypothetical protein
MNKVVLGLILGGILGIFDGLTAWFTPEARPMMIGIVIGSTVKGIIAGAIAGWFARKVNSVPAGIAFGLFVGLVLAYAVAAMPSETGEHYYFEIMLPGSIVGAIVGWATQRYGKPAAPKAVTAAALIIIALAFPLQAEVAPADAFASLKSLAGRWEGKTVGADFPVAVEYKVTGGGGTVMETLFPGQPHEMVTMYSLEPDGITATHYCAGNNQPTARLNRTNSTAKELVFDFVKVSGLNTKGHMRDWWHRLRDDGQLESQWNSNEGAPKHVLLSRVK